MRGGLTPEPPQPQPRPFRLPAAPAQLGDDVVHLRLLTPDDVPLLIRGSEDEDVVRWTFLPPRLDAGRAGALVDRWQSLVRDGRARQFVIAPAAEPPAACGAVTLVLQDAEDPDCVDVAYWLLPEGRGRGLVTRAVSLLLAWAFEVAGCRRAALHTKLGNTASEAVARRCGFVEVGPRTWDHGGEKLRLRRWERLP